MRAHLNDELPALKTRICGSLIGAIVCDNAPRSQA
jgi:hypothetical protein